MDFKQFSTHFWPFFIQKSVKNEGLKSFINKSLDSCELTCGNLKGLPEGK